MDESNSLIHTSSSFPPKRDYFKYYKELRINHNLVSGTGSHKNFPMLISLLDSDLHDDVQPTGNDIAFANNTAWLDHELELFKQNYTATQAKVVAWVRIPTLSTSVDTIIYLYYGNASMSARENPEGVWNSNYEGVWHLSESPSDPSPQFQDRTLNNNDGTAYGGMSSEDQVSGQIDGSIDFDGTDDYINLGSSINIASSSFSVSTWAKRGSSSTADIIFQQGPPGNNTGFHAGFRSNGLFTFAFWADDLDTSQSYNDTDWHHWTCTYDASTKARKIYRDGVNIASNTASNHFLGSGTFYLGYDGMVNEGFDGQLDEARLLNIALSGNWINTSYNNQNNQESFYSIGKENKVSDPPNAHYFTYYKIITIDHNKVAGTGSHTNFPVLISLIDENLRNHTQPDGDDIAFSMGGDWLNHEIELFNQSYSDTHAQLLAWVRVPFLSTTSNTTIMMYYGNSTMSSRQNSTGVWSTNYAAVWHLKENGTGTYGEFKDSTSNNNDGRGGSGNPSYVPTRVVGKISYGQEFDGTDDYIDCLNSPSLNIVSDTITVTGWIYSEDVSPNGGIALKSNSLSAGYYGLTFEPSEIWVYTDNYQPNWNWNTGITIGSAGWHHVAYTYNGNYRKLYVDGVERANSSSPGTLKSNTMPLVIGRQEWSGSTDGIIDEVHISSTNFSASWIKTEYNNQNNPTSFFTISSEKEFDNTPPTYEKPKESLDPLELGETEVITINVSDPSGIYQVLIEFEDDNDTMTNIGGDTWQYDSWTPITVGNYTYIIWMEDNYHNWNSTMGTIEVIDTTPPTYSNLIESADPLQFGQNETIEITVFDLSGVNQTLLEYDSTNHSMVQDGNKWSWSKWKPTSPITYPYTIYMQDNQNNWNMTSGNITVITLYAPFIENLTESEDPLELGNDIIINVDVYDVETNVSTVLIELDGINCTMSNISVYRYEYIWNASEYIERGYSVGLPLIVNYKIYANDTENNWNSYSANFKIIDTTPPTFSALSESNDTLELGNKETITINCTDLAGINEVTIEFEGGNYPMNNTVGNTWEYDSWLPESIGNYTYIIWCEDKTENWNNISGSILVRDTTPPIYSDLTENSNPTEIGTPLLISINCTDLADIKYVSIEFENDNHTMTNIGGDIWQYSSWMPNSIGNYTYKIYIRDNNENLNYLNSWILFEDTIIPIYSNLIESADPSELGDNQIITINTYDFAGINQCLIEFEGANHSMINIYGNTWQFDSWIPNNWTFNPYRIYVEDKSGNWNFIIGNITVQDTTPPLQPIFTNSPSGDISGIIVFDWSDGSDPSGIAYYILIIDNESDHESTPGYVYRINITNIGPESSYYELTDNLPPGQYWYFLAQTDGVGHQSSYARGSFTIKSNPNNNSLMIYIIIGLIIAFIMVSLTAAIIVRKKMQRKISPYFKKIPLKIIIPHLTKISSSPLDLVKQDFQSKIFEKKQDLVLLDEESLDDDKLETNINEIKVLGEKLFNEGAYLEAQKQFELGKQLFLKHGKEEEAKLFSELSSGIEGLIEEREKRLEILEHVKIEGDSVKIFELFYEIIEISKNLRDLDGVNMYKSELIQFFQINKFKLINIQRYIFELEQKADSLIRNNLFEKAAHVYEKCENFSDFLVQLGKEEETKNIRKFKNKREESLKKILNK